MLNKQYGNVWTPNGPQFGQINSLVGKGESIINLKDQQGSIVRSGQVGRDTIPSNVTEDDDNTIFGNLKRLNGADTFAQAAAPYTQQLEQINNMEKKYKSYENKSSLAERTQKFQQKQFQAIKKPIMNKLQSLAQEQAYVHKSQQYNCGKTQRFDAGKPSMFDGINREVDYSPLFRAANLMSVTDKGNKDTTYKPWLGSASAKWMEDMPGYLEATGRLFDSNGNASTLFNTAVNGNIPYTKSQPSILGRFDSKGGPQHASPELVANYIQDPLGLGAKRQVYRWDPTKSTAPTLYQLALIMNKPTSSIKYGLYRDDYYSPFNFNNTTTQPYDELQDESYGQKQPNKFTSFLNQLFNKNNYLGDYHTIPGLATAGVGLGQYLRARDDEPKGSDIYAGNKYEHIGLNGLAGLRQNPYEYLRQMYDAERRGAYQIANSGNPIGKTNQRIALALGSQSNMAKQLAAVNSENLNRKQHYYDSALSVGAQDAARMQEANKYDFETFTKAHAAKEQMRQMGLRNMLSALWQTQANRFKRDMGNAQLKLYNKTLDADKAKMLSQIAAKYGI